MLEISFSSGNFGTPAGGDLHNDKDHYREE
jgi:hypothetical protein